MRAYQRVAMLCALLAIQAAGQTPSDLATLKGLAPISALPGTDAGKAALQANLTLTQGIQKGTVALPTLLPFPEQQQQALRDAFITSLNLAELADGLGTTLGSAYLARAHYLDRTHATLGLRALSDLIAYANATTSAHAGAAKYFFANATTDGKTPASPQALAILTALGGTADVFGKSYGLPAGAPGADPYGNSRPFQTGPDLSRFSGLDYFNTPADNLGYDRGPIMNLIASPAYPSGHTTYGYTGAVLLAVLVPERYPQMIARGAEYGSDRILMGAHYTMDVIGGRTLALYDMAHLLANDPAYLGRDFKGVPALKDFQAALKQARTELVAALESGCGGSVADSAREDIGRFSNPDALEACHAATLTYSLPVVFSRNAGAAEDVGKLAPEAGYLLTAAFPALTLDQADRILTETEGAGGGFLDDGSAFGVYSRLNLYAAAKRAAGALQGR